jgi:anti-sigma B factor antagonist
MKSVMLQQGPATVIALEGNLMGGPDASSLNSQIHELLGQGKKTVVLDLSKVQFINSSGLGLLIGTVNAVRTAGGSLKVAGASEKIRTIIKITKLEGLFELYGSVDEAVTAMKK